MKADVLKKAKACSGPCEKCANNVVVFGPRGRQCKFGSMGPVTDEFMEQTKDPMEPTTYCLKKDKCCDCDGA